MQDWKMTEKQNNKATGPGKKLWVYDHLLFGRSCRFYSPSVIFESAFCIALTVHEATNANTSKDVQLITNR